MPNLYSPILLLSLSLGLLPFQLHADEEEETDSKLPQAGDFAIGMNAVPFLAYIGNAFNNSTYNAPSTQFVLGDRTLYGKYFLTPDTAIRGRARLSMYTDVQKAAVANDAQNPDNFDPSDTVIDERYIRNANLMVTGGLEKRRGNSTIQGFYGAEATLGLRRNTTIYAYGNDLDYDNPTPTTSTFTGGSFSATSRTLDSRPGGTLSLGARAFAGGELFLGSKVSIGGEFGYGMGFALTGSGETTTESYDQTDGEAVEQTYELPGGGSFLMDTDNLGGSIFLMVHF